MEKERWLNLYSGLGGNVVKWPGDIHVTAVEKTQRIADVYKEMNPTHNVVVGDAMEYLRENHKKYSRVWASPPCQKNSRMVKATRHDINEYPDLSIYQIIIFLDNFFKGRYIVENVIPYYEPLIKPTQKIGRHLFWSNFEISPVEEPKIKGFINKSTLAAAEELKSWLGIKYKGSIYYEGNHCPCQVLRNCVHPDIGEHVRRESNKYGMFNLNQD